MSIRAGFFRMMMRAQNINPIAHPGMKDKMKQMSAKYLYTKPKKRYSSGTLPDRKLYFIFILKSRDQRCIMQLDKLN